MTPSRIVVIGASAADLGALQTILEGLSAPLPAAVCVVVHGAQDAETPFTPSLRRPGRLPVDTATPRASRSAPGVIVVATPDRHLLVKEGRVGVTRGPRENLWRPAIDVLFRSAAVGYGPNAVGVLLNDALEDAKDGLAAIKRCRGVTLVQASPAARGSVRADHVLPAGEIPALIEHLLATAPRPEGNVPKVLRREMQRLETGQRARSATVDGGSGELTPFACPECHGPLWARRGATLEFHCQIGHVIGEQRLVTGVGDHLEAALWSAIQGFEQRARLSTVLAGEAVHRERGGLARQHREHAAAAQRHADSLRELWMAETSAVANAPETGAPLPGLVE